MSEVRKMNKPLTMVIKETKNKLVNICNESGLPPIVLDLIMQGIYSEIHSLAERQTAEEEVSYAKMHKDDSENIEVLNVSSIKGKERKLAFPTNERLRSYNPPFVMPSFVKLDSLTRVESADWSNLQVLNAGRTLDRAELERIKGLI